MTDEELAAIRQRAEKTTPGPWEYDDFAGSIYTQHADHQDSPWVAEAGENDGPFIVHAHDDIPALLAEVERLSAREATWREIAQAVATGDMTWADDFGDDYCIFGTALCDYDRYRHKDLHSATCPVTKARALLANEHDDNGSR
jgi:hypothetical protein